MGNLDFTLYEYLKNSGINPVRFTSGKDETTIRCPYCGDSSHSSSKTHLYIHNVPPFFFHCQRCETSGTGKSLVKQLRISDATLTQYMNRAVREYAAQGNFKGSINDKNRKELKILPNNVNGNLELGKKQYLENRLGKSLSYEEIADLRYILNLEDFVRNNNIQLNLSDRDMRMMNHFQNYYSIFLLADNNTIIGRYMGDLTETKLPRYRKISLQKTATNNKKFYTIKNSIDLTKPVHKIYLTEGIYDLLGVHSYLNHEKDSSEIFIANNGKGYLSSLDYLLGIGIMNAEIEIYSDIDVKDNLYKNLVNTNLLAKNNGIKVIYNTKKGEKDFGVSVDRILPSLPKSFNALKL